MRPDSRPLLLILILILTILPKDGVALLPSSLLPVLLILPTLPIDGKMRKMGG